MQTPPAKRARRLLQYVVSKQAYSKDSISITEKDNRVFQKACAAFCGASFKNSLCLPAKASIRHDRRIKRNGCMLQMLAVLRESSKNARNVSLCPGSIPQSPNTAVSSMSVCSVISCAPLLI